MTYFKKLRSSLYFLLLASVLPSSAFADIEKLSVEGNYRIDQGSILAVVKTKAGDPLDLEQLRRDLKSIYRLGFFDPLSSGPYFKYPFISGCADL